MFGMTMKSPGLLPSTVIEAISSALLQQSHIFQMLNWIACQRAIQQTFILRSLLLPFLEEHSSTVLKRPLLKNANNKYRNYDSRRLRVALWVKCPFYVREKVKSSNPDKVWKIWSEQKQLKQLPLDIGIFKMYLRNNNSLLDS